MVGRVRARTDLRTHPALVVRMHRDDEAGGWWADSDDIPGLTSEAPTYDSLRERVRLVIPELCQANGIDLANRTVSFNPRPGAQTMEKEQFDAALTELGNRIWEAIRGDDTIVDSIHELADVKLSLVGVTSENTDLSDYAAQAIMPDGEDPKNLVRPKEFVLTQEWAKHALVNLTLDWVVDQALARMRIENKWPSQQEEGLSKP